MLRKKNIVLTAEASAAIAAGADPAQVTAGLPETELTTEAQAAATAATEATEAAATAATEAATTAAAAAEAEPTAAEAAAAALAAAPADAPDPQVALLTTQLQTSQDEVVELKVELSQANSKITSMTNAQSGLLGIAAESAQKMQIALGQTPTDMSILEPTALVTQYESIKETFNKHFGIGAKAAIPVEDDRNTTAAPAPAAQVRATSLRKEDK